jgi:phage-related protein
MKEIIFYRDETGKCPVEEFLDSLTGKQAQKVTWVLRLIEELDHIPSSYLKNLVNTDGIMEVRVKLGTNIFRILGFTLQQTTFVLTNGFQKKSRKTPRNEIDLAERRKQDYISRRNRT